MIRVVKQSTTATLWPVPLALLGTGRYASRLRSALTWAGRCQTGNGLGIAGDEILVVAADAVEGGDRSA